MKTNLFNQIVFALLFGSFLNSVCAAEEIAKINQSGVVEVRVELKGEEALTIWDELSQGLFKEEILIKDDWALVLGNLVYEIPKSEMREIEESSNPDQTIQAKLDAFFKEAQKKFEAKSGCSKPAAIEKLPACSSPLTRKIVEELYNGFNLEKAIRNSSSFGLPFVQRVMIFRPNPVNLWKYESSFLKFAQQTRENFSVSFQVKNEERLLSIRKASVALSSPTILYGFRQFMKEELICYTWGLQFDLMKFDCGDIVATDSIHYPRGTELDPKLRDKIILYSISKMCGSGYTHLKYETTHGICTTNTLTEHHFDINGSVFRIQHSPDPQVPFSIEKIN